MAQHPGEAATVSAPSGQPLRLWSADAPSDERPEVTIIIVSYNTRDLTMTCLETLLACGGDVLAEVVVYDNASQDGSSEAVQARFPGVRTIAATDNIGFAAANNLVAKMAHAPYLLLLNPDTETYDNAIRRLVDFAEAHPEGGIYGGRTFYPDGTLNPFSCLNEISIRSLVNRLLGLDKLISGSEFFNPEQIGGWKRDSVRHVDIVVGCFFLIRTALWHELGGFDLKYFMYGEEADLCHRARRKGYAPLITPDANIMHLVGASTSLRSDKIQLVAQARVTLIRDHWPAWKAPIGIFLLKTWIASRFALSGVMSVFEPAGKLELHDTWRRVWTERQTWLAGYRR